MIAVFRQGIAVCQDCKFPTCQQRGETVGTKGLRTRDSRLETNELRDMRRRVKDGGVQREEGRVESGEREWKEKREREDEEGL